MPEPKPAIVWDLPTRLFHWTLVVLIALQFASGEFGIVPMAWHYWMGYATLTLIVFRIVWGFVGSGTSRFADFVRGPGAVVRYVSALVRGNGTPHRAGHNPLGGWSVVLMLAGIALQAISGLFASDDLTETGPLAARVSDAAVELMTRIHHWNRYVIAILIVLHIGAVVLYAAIGRDRLIGAMLHGRREDVEGDARIVPAWRALAIVAAGALLVWVLVAWGSG